MSKVFPVVRRSMKDYFGRFFNDLPSKFGNARLCVGLSFLTWIPALSMPFEVWPYTLSLPVVFFKGVNRFAFAWCLIILWVWLGIPSVPGRGFALLKAILPVLVGGAAGRLIREKHGCLLNYMLAAAVPFCMLSVVQWLYRVPVPTVWLSGQERWNLPTRVTAVYQNPNLFAEVLLFLIPIGIAWILAAEHNWTRALGWGWVVLAFSSLMLTFSYGAWTAACFSILVLAAICFTKHPVRMVLLVILPAVAAFVIIGTLHGSTAAYRWALWQEVWLIFLKHPWGVGPGGLRMFLAVSPTPAVHAHNLILQMLTETGILSIPFLILILRTVYRNITKTMDFNRAGAAAALSGLLLYSMVDYIWATPLLTGLFWLGLGMLEEPV